MSMWETICSMSLGACLWMIFYPFWEAALNPKPLKLHKFPQEQRKTALELLLDSRVAELRKNPIPPPPKK